MLNLQLSLLVIEQPLSRLSNSVKKRKMARGYESPSVSDLEESAPFIDQERLEKIRASKAPRSAWGWICLIARNVWRYLLVAILSSLVTMAVLRSHGLLHIEKSPSCEDMDYIRKYCSSGRLSSTSTVRRTDISSGDYAPIRDLDRSFHVETFSPFNYSTSEYTIHPSEGNVSDKWMALGQDCKSASTP